VLTQTNNSCHTNICSFLYFYLNIFFILLLCAILWNQYLFFHPDIIHSRKSPPPLILRCFFVLHTFGFILCIRQQNICYTF
jgi:hypothetical protein